MVIKTRETGFLCTTNDETIPNKILFCIQYFENVKNSKSLLHSFGYQCSVCVCVCVASSFAFHNTFLICMAYEFKKEPIHTIINILSIDCMTWPTFMSHRNIYEGGLSAHLYIYI